MRISILFLLISISSHCISQTDSTKWGLRFHVGYNRCGHQMKATDSASVFSEDLAELEAPRFLPSFGLSATRQLNPHVRIHAGLQYNALGHRIDSLSAAELYAIRYRYDLIEVPIGMDYTLRPDKKISPLFGAQFQLGQLMNYSWTYRTFDSNTEVQNKLEYTSRSIYLSTTIQAGMRIILHKHYSFESLLHYHHYFQSIEKSPIERQYNQIGVTLSLVRYI